MNRGKKKTKARRIFSPKEIMVGMSLSKVSGLNAAGKLPTKSMLKSKGGMGSRIPFGQHFSLRTLFIAVLPKVF